MSTLATAEILELFIHDGAWMARTNNPETRRLFGTGTLPTAFLAAMPWHEVARELGRLNPRAEIRVLESGVAA